MMAAGATRATRAFLAFCLVTAMTVLVAIGVAIGASCLSALPSAPAHISPAPVSCPHSDSILDLQRRVVDVENGLDAASVEWTERVMQLSHSVGVGLVDVACLYRWHLVATHYGLGTDEPVPGSWLGGRLSPLWPATMTAADCDARWLK